MRHSGGHGWLRPGHLIVLAVLAVLVAGGAITGFFGLFGAKVSEPQRLASCFDHHHVNVGSVTSIVGEPATLLSSSAAAPTSAPYATSYAMRGSKSKLASAVLTCVRRVSR